MRRLLPVALIIASPLTFAQTTLDITVPGGQVCSYATGAVTNGQSPGHLQATATNQSGAGCGTGPVGSVTFGPASPASASPQNVGANIGSSTISFQAVNANVSCTGAFTPSTGASFVGGNPLCTGSACQAPVAVTANFDNETGADVTYNVAVTCTGSTGQATSNTSVVVPAHITQGSCFSIPDGKGNVFNRLTGKQPVYDFSTTVSKDITNFNAVFGNTAHPSWPGAKGVTEVMYLPTNSYISLAFTVPANFFSGINQSVVGHYTINQSSYSAPVSMSISTHCGDFSAPGSSGTVLYRGNNLISQSFLAWASTDLNGLKDDGTTVYYLNIINADVSKVNPNGGGQATSLANGQCTGGKCSNPIENKNASWTD